jgi:hypothetical protein
MTSRKGKRALDEADALAARAIAEFRNAARVLGAPEVRDAFERLRRASKLTRRAARKAARATLARWLRPSELRRQKWIRTAALLHAAEQRRKGSALLLIWLANCANGLLGIDHVAGAVDDLTWLPRAEEISRRFARDLHAVIRGLRRLTQSSPRSPTMRALAEATAELREQDAAIHRDRPRFILERGQGKRRVRPTAGESAMHDPQ